MEKIIDLHIHTNCSDGALSAKEVIDQASINGLNTIAITDHDTTEAYTPEIEEYAKSKGINLIHGVEISTKTKKTGIHVLGYNIDINNQNFKEELKKIRNARHDYLYKVSKKLESLGYILNVKELDKIDSVTKAHIARDIINNKENEEVLLKEFTHIPNMGEFIETIMNENCKAYVKKETITPKEAATLIRKYGGKAILAHPVAYQYEDNLTEEDILELVKDMQIDGIEANYIYVDKNNNIIDDTEKWNTFAKKHNLNTTIGSDFHNHNNYVKIGLINTNINLTSQEIDNIINYIMN